MGDVKLVALIGLVLGSVDLASVLVAAGAGILLGGLGAIGALLSGASRKHAIPFGPFLAAGAVIGALLGARAREPLPRSPPLGEPQDAAHGLVAFMLPVVAGAPTIERVNYTSGIPLLAPRVRK